MLEDKIEQRELKYFRLMEDLKEKILTGELKARSEEHTSELQSH